MSVARAYYNEHDPFCAEWLRNLIAAGHIAPGDVDERSIEDVKPSDLRGYTQCHFFAGIGLWSYALRLAGWPDDRPCWSGSCPCQPFSAAGARAGFADERHLWPAWFHLIRECRPPIVFGEQVAAAIRHGWIDLVCADLEAASYASGFAILGAHSVGAPHIRQRLFFVADTDGRHAGAERQQRGGEQRQQPQDCGAMRMADATVSGQSWQRRCGKDGTSQCGRTLGVGDTDCKRQCAADNATRSGDVGRAGEADELGDADSARSPARSEATPAARQGNPALAAGFWSDAEWIACHDGKARPVKPGIFPLAHGYPGPRVGILRASGNAINPEVAAAFIRAYVGG